jgi:lipoprotein-releasing system ATP-binding protein
VSAVIEAVAVTRILPAAVPVTLVKNVSLTIGSGEFIAITGPSGSGKSSLLYLLGLLDRPTSGEIRIAGADTSTLAEADRARLRLASLGFVFQFHFLLPEFTVCNNVELPMRKLGLLTRAEMRERSEGLLNTLGLAGHFDKHPDQLSGGQRQRVAVARALANDPLVVLADEPTGSLDSKSSEQVFMILSDLVRQQEKSVVAVTHDLGIAARTHRRIELVDGGIVADRIQDEDDFSFAQNEG